MNRRGRLTWFGMRDGVAWWMIAFLVLAALIGPLVASADPLAITDVIARRLVPPFGRDAAGGWHLFGTDRFGRDILARLLLAARVSLAVGLVGTVVASAIGVAVGAVAGWRGGIIDHALMAICDALLSIPRIILLLLAASLWKPGLATVAIVVGGTGWMAVARLVRSEVIRLSHRDFVEAARAAGSPGRRTLLRHVLPNAMGPALVATALGLGNAILLESGLAFLGLGVQPPYPSWGNMIAGGRDLIVVAPWVSLVPCVALVVSVAAVTVAADGLQARLSPRTAERGSPFRVRQV